MGINISIVLFLFTYISDYTEGDVNGNHDTSVLSMIEEDRDKNDHIVDTAPNPHLQQYELAKLRNQNKDIVKAMEEGDDDDDKSLQTTKRADDTKMDDVQRHPRQSKGEEKKEEKREEKKEEEPCSREYVHLYEYSNWGKMTGDVELLEMNSPDRVTVLSAADISKRLLPIWDGAIFFFDEAKCGRKVIQFLNEFMEKHGTWHSCNPQGSSGFCTVIIESIPPVGGSAPLQPLLLLSGTTVAERHCVSRSCEIGKFEWLMHSLLIEAEKNKFWPLVPVKPFLPDAMHSVAVTAALCTTGTMREMIPSVLRCIRNLQRSTRHMVPLCIEENVITMMWFQTRAKYWPDINSNWHLDHIKSPNRLFDYEVAFDWIMVLCQGIEIDKTMMLNSVSIIDGIKAFVENGLPLWKVKQGNFDVTRPRNIIPYSAKFTRIEGATIDQIICGGLVAAKRWAISRHLPWLWHQLDNLKDRYKEEEEGVLIIMKDAWLLPNQLKETFTDRKVNLPLVVTGVFIKEKSHYVSVAYLPIKDALEWLYRDKDNDNNESASRDYLLSPYWLIYSLAVLPPTSNENDDNHQSHYYNKIPESTCNLVRIFQQECAQGNDVVDSNDDEKVDDIIDAFVDDSKWSNLEILLCLCLELPLSSKDEEEKSKMTIPSIAYRRQIFVLEAVKCFLSRKLDKLYLTEVAREAALAIFDIICPCDNRNAFQWILCLELGGQVPLGNQDEKDEKLASPTSLPPPQQGSTVLGKFPGFIGGDEHLSDGPLLLMEVINVALVAIKSSRESFNKLSVLLVNLLMGMGSVQRLFVGQGTRYVGWQMNNFIKCKVRGTESLPRTSAVCTFERLNWHTCHKNPLGIVGEELLYQEPPYALWAFFVHLVSTQIAECRIPSLELEEVIRPELGTKNQFMRLLLASVEQGGWFNARTHVIKAKRFGILTSPISTDEKNTESITVQEAIQLSEFHRIDIQQALFVSSIYKVEEKVPSQHPSMGTERSHHPMEIWLKPKLWLNSKDQDRASGGFGKSLADILKDLAPPPPHLPSPFSPWIKTHHHNHHNHHAQQQQHRQQAKNFGVSPVAANSTTPINRRVRSRSRSRSRSPAHSHSKTTSSKSRSLHRRNSRSRSPTITTTPRQGPEEYHKSRSSRKTNWDLPPTSSSENYVPVPLGTSKNNQTRRLPRVVPRTHNSDHGERKYIEERNYGNDRWHGRERGSASGGGGGGGSGEEYRQDEQYTVQSVVVVADPSPRSTVYKKTTALTTPASDSSIDSYPMPSHRSFG